MPLSKVLLVIMSLTACFTSALRSMNAGTLPGPTPNAGLPALYAARTIAEPPVATITEILLFFISSSVACMEVLLRQLTSPAGPPAFSAASCSSCAAAQLHLIALG